MLPDNFAPSKQVAKSNLPFSVGALVGIVLGCIAGLSLLGLGIGFGCYRKYKKSMVDNAAASQTKSEKPKGTGKISPTEKWRLPSPTGIPTNHLPPLNNVVGDLPPQTIKQQPHHWSQWSEDGESTSLDGSLDGSEVSGATGPPVDGGIPQAAVYDPTCKSARNSPAPPAWDLGDRRLAATPGPRRLYDGNDPQEPNYKVAPMPFDSAC